MDVKHIFENENTGSQKTITATFSDEEVSDMKCFVNRFNELLESDLVGKIDIGLIAKISNGRLDWLVAAPTTLERAALLHLFRPFILQKERTHFGKIKNVIIKRFGDESVSNLFSKLGAPFSIKQPDDHMYVEYKCKRYDIDEIIKCWLNTSEYHTDDDEKRDIIEMITKIIPIEGVRVICLKRLNEQFDSIYKLYNFISLLLKYPRAKYVYRNVANEPVIDLIPLD